jgi:nucleoside-diphosphate-sugar epimerase
MKILIIGGNRYFGRTLASNLLDKGHAVTLLNRGHTQDQFGDRVERIMCDRSDETKMEHALKDKTWDLVFDQICFDYQEAKMACELFQNKTPRYIFTSSQSVYDAGENIKEETVDPFNFTIKEYADRFNDYCEAKRQAEVSFFENAPFKVAAIRFSLVFGEDDYTKRLWWHINQIKNKQKIFLPKPEAKISLISQKQAAECLELVGFSNITGPVNCACSEPIALNQLIHTIEEKVQQKAKILAYGQKPEQNSPIGIENHWYMNTQKLENLGVELNPISSWLPQLIDYLIENN